MKRKNKNMFFFFSLFNDTLNKNFMRHLSVMIQEVKMIENIVMFGEFSARVQKIGFLGTIIIIIIILTEKSI